MKILAIILTLFSLTLAIESQAQVYFKSEYIGSSSFKDENNNKTGGSGDMFKVNGGFSMPLSFKQDENNRIKVWAVSLDAAYAKYNNKQIPTFMHPNDIINTTLSISHLRPIGRKWSLLAVLGGGIYSDPSHIKAQSILGSGGLVFIYHLRDNLDVGIGVGVTNSYGVPLGMPMGYLNWRIDGKYEVKVKMLEAAEVSAAVTFNDWFKLRLIGFEVDGMSAVMDVDGKSKIFGSVSMKSGLQADFRIGKSSSIQLTGGGVWYRDASVINRSIKDYFKWFGREFDPNFQPSLYFQVGYNLGF
ncbi:MAG: DUF6268 family outer membrane beta-barrel protein [Tannerellaceae bacterium]|nr:DUF6268 family outer membrane beta-barrel protein [Tannerellaceae bacterium]MCD8265373.1 DUF6268 family outer membrane beta-barrel protein [Tannerellaceae bacterium]